VVAASARQGGATGPEASCLTRFVGSLPLAFAFGATRIVPVDIGYPNEAVSKRTDRVVAR